MTQYRYVYLFLILSAMALLYSCSYGDNSGATINDLYPVDGDTADADIPDTDTVDGDTGDSAETDVTEEEQTAEQEEPDLPDTSWPIPDGDPTGLYLVRVVTESFEVHRVRVVIDATHPASEELFITLTSPQGTSRVIRPTGTVHEVNMHFDQVLFDFNGEEATGDWTVRVVDTVPGNAGSVTYWALQFMFAPPADEDEELADAEPEAEEEETSLWVDIPDDNDNGVALRFEEAQEGLVDRVVIWLDVDHPFEGDIEIRLTAPDGNEKVLLSSMHQAERIIPDPISTTLFRGYDARGVWTVNVADVVQGDTGRVRLAGAKIYLLGGDEDFADSETADTDADQDIVLSNVIPDNNPQGLSRTFYIDLNETVGQVTATVGIEHPRHTDLVVYAQNPSGQRVEMQRTLQSTGSLLQLKTYSFYGQEARGLWILTVVDTREGQEGYLVSAELSVQPLSLEDGDTETVEEPEQEEAEITEAEAEDSSVDAVEEDVIDYDDGRYWIPDNDPNGITLPVSVSTSSQAGNVCLDIAFVHSFTRDLTIELESPQGTTVTLLTQDSDLPSPNLDHRFTTGAFHDENEYGEWRIHVADMYEGDVGYVASFALTFQCDIPVDGDIDEEAESEEEMTAGEEEEFEAEAEPEEEPEYLPGGACDAPVPLTFPSTLYIDPQGTESALTPATSCAGWTLDGPETVFAFEVTELRPHFFTVTSETDYGLYVLKDCSDVYSCIQGIDAVGPGSEMLTFKPGALGTYYLVVDTVASETPPAPFELFSFTCIKETYASTDTPVAIPDNNSLESTINIPLNFIINKMDLNVDITHPYAGDIILTLETPWGDTLPIRSRQGGSDDNIHDTYQLWKLHGQRAAGTWKLTVTDASTGSTGTLDGWNLRFYCDPEVAGCDPQAEPPKLCTDDNGHNLNDRPCRAMEIDLPYTDSGYVCRTRRLNEDMDDYYGFWLDPGDTITVTVTMPNDTDNVDVYLHAAPYDQYNPLVQAAGSDNPEVLTYTASVFGYYWLRIRTATRNTEAAYDLVVDIERPQVDGDNDDDVSNVDLTVPGCDVNAAAAQCTNDAGNNQNNIPCRALYVPLPYFSGSNMYVCNVEYEDNPDWYAFYLSPGQNLTVTADFESQYDIDLYLYDAPPEELYDYVRSATSLSEPEVLTYSDVDEYALYWLRVKVYGSGSDAPYTLRIETD